jgi:UDP-N-acetylmuramate dehydrogenase
VSALEVAAGLLGERAVHDHPLGALTTYRVGGPAALGFVARTVEDLHEAGRAVRASGVEVLVVGRGSNMLVADAGFRGLAVLLGDGFQQIDLDGTDVTAGGAVLLPVLARKTVAAGLTGLEWAVGVPGSVGGAVRMNAGGHGSDVAATLRGVRVVDLGTGDDVEVDAKALDLRFRGSAVTDQQVVVWGHFALQRGDRMAGEAELAEIVHWRREHQPGGQNCGSVFINPVPGAVAAGQVIDELGLRGLRIGTAHVSEKHANFIQGEEGGSADDVLSLLTEVRRRVRLERGIDLRCEVRLVGFDAERRR